MTNLCQNYQRMDRGRGGAVLAVWLVMNFEYCSKFPGGVGCSRVLKRNAMEVGLRGGGFINMWPEKGSS